MRSFASDNNSGVHPLIMEALVKANVDHAVAYGSDQWSEAFIAKTQAVFGTDCLPLLTFNGTGSNSVALQLMTRPYHSIICTEMAHILVDECGSPTKSTGCVIRAVPAPDGKLTPASVLPLLTGFGNQQHSQPKVLYISQCTELGTVYTLEEIKALTTLAHAHDMYVLMDGARLANAAVALQVGLQEMTAGCGVDIVSFGGTKNGLLLGECVLIFAQELKESALFVRKQSAQLASKMRFLACQLTALFTDDLWKKNATQANESAYQLYTSLNAYPEVTFTQQVVSNQLFLQMPRPVIDALLQEHTFYLVNEATSEIRLVTSFDTTAADIEAFITSFQRALTTYRAAQ